MSDFILVELRGWVLLLLFHHYLKDAVPAVDMATIGLQSKLRLSDADAALRGLCPRPPRHHVGPWRGLVSLDEAEHELHHIEKKDTEQDWADEEEHLISNSLYEIHRNLCFSVSL